MEKFVILILVIELGLSSITNGFARSSNSACFRRRPTDPHFGAGECPMHPMSATTTSLSVFGWFQSKDDEKVDSESLNEAVTANLSGVAGIMNSMSNFKTSQRVSDRTNTVLQDLANTIVEGTAADGKVKVTFNGQQRPMGVQIDDGYFQSLGRKTGAGELNKALTEAMREAHTKSSQKMEEKLKALYSDLGFETR